MFYTISRPSARPRKQGDITHVFFLHSYVPALIAETIIEQKELASDEIIIWSTRNRGRPWLELPGATRLLENVPFTATQLDRSSNLKRNWSRLKQIDAEISLAVNGKKFHLYIPHSYWQFFQILATHRLCIGFSYLEEGLAAYRENSEIVSSLASKKQNVWSLSRLQRILFRSRILGEEFYNRHAQCAYGTSPFSFVNVDIPRKIIDVSWKAMPDIANSHNDCAVILLPPCGNSNGRELVGLEKTLLDVVEILRNSHFRKIYVRSHPESDINDFNELYYDIFGEKDQRFIPDPLEHPVEMICASSSVTIISSGSSTSIYASRMGREIISFSGIYSENCPQFSETWNKLRTYIEVTFDGTDIRSYVFHRKHQQTAPLRCISKDD